MDRRRRTRTDERQIQVAMMFARRAVATTLTYASLVCVPSCVYAQDVRVVTISPDSTHVLSRRALSELLADASRRNVLPTDLLSYQSRVETEIAVILKREEGTEAVGAVEQVASVLRWTRTGVYNQHVVGYRAQQSGANVSMLTAFQTGWLTPSLYGNRLRVVRRTRTADAAFGAVATARTDGSDTLLAVHPLAVDRDQYYRFAGGDTVVTMRVGDRAIPIVHVRVQPRADVQAHVLLFDGELDLDASRGTLVRMRGTFVRMNSTRGPIAGALFDAVAFIEYENAERMGAYWLPARQRVELQVTAPFIGDGRAVVRIVSRFTDMQVNDTMLDARSLAAADSLRARGRRRLTFATPDSLSRFGAWRSDIGDVTGGMHADDFDDIGPDRWRVTGRPRFDVTAPRASDVFHFNRVEGVYTGLGVKIAMRDVAPGVVVRANAGWAWNEGTTRGRLSLERTRGAWTTELRGGRSLDNTNDFRVPFDSGSTVGALFSSVDPYDYVDRRSVTFAVMRSVAARTLLLRAEAGYADDRYRPARYLRSPFGGDAFRPNRGVDAGGYVRSAALVEWHPDVNAEFVRPGMSARVSYERGDGSINWQRFEGRVVARKPFGPFVAIARSDIGVVLGNTPPSQQLFELGKQQNLPGYLDKEFAGTRAAVLRGQLAYTSPWLRQPIRARRLFLPAIAPGLSVGLQGGWTEIPDAAARAAVRRLGALPDSAGVLTPVSRATGRARASATAGLRFFSGGVFVGATRAIDHAAPWRALVTVGQQW